MPTVKNGLMILWYVVVFLALFHPLRKRTCREVSKTWGAALLSAFLAFLAVLPFYRFSLSLYAGEVKEKILMPFYENLLPVIFGVAIAIGAITLGLVLSTKARMSLWGWAHSPVTKYEYRSFAQTLACLSLAYFAWVDLRIAFTLTMGLAFLFTLIEYFRLSYVPEVLPGITRRPSRRVRLWGERLVGTAVERPIERRLYVPSIFIIIGIGLVVPLFPKNFVLASILMLALADPIAALVGRRFGRTKLIYNPEKSLEGACAFFGVALAILAPLGIGVQTALVVALSVTVFESVSAAGTDNLVVPLMTGLMLYSLA